MEYIVVWGEYEDVEGLYVECSTNNNQLANNSQLLELLALSVFDTTHSKSHNNATQPNTPATLVFIGNLLHW
jgi:hypothetical protein